MAAPGAAYRRSPVAPTIEWTERENATLVGALWIPTACSWFPSRRIPSYNAYPVAILAVRRSCPASLFKISWHGLSRP